MRIRKIGIPPLISDNTLHAFCRFYEFERWLREMVYTELKTFYETGWQSEVQNAINRSRSGRYSRCGTYRRPPSRIRCDRA